MEAGFEGGDEGADTGDAGEAGDGDGAVEAVAGVAFACWGDEEIAADGGEDAEEPEGK